MRLSVYADAYRSGYPIGEDDYPWPEVCDEIEALAREVSATKELAFAFNTTRFQPHAWRGDATAIEVTAIIIDVDALAEIPEIPWAALVYASPSDPNPDGTRRVRIISPITRALEPTEIHAARIAYAEALGIMPGQGVEACLDPARIFFAGTIEGAPPRDVWRFDGPAVDVDELLAAPRISDAWPAPVALRTDASAPREFADNADAITVSDEMGAGVLEPLLEVWAPAGQPMGRRVIIRALGGYLARRGWGDRDIADLVRELPSDRPEDRAALAVESAQQARSGAVTAGFGELEAYLGPVARRVEVAAKDPREPPGFGGVWSETWARVFETWQRKDVARNRPVLAVVPDALEATERGPLMLDLDGHGQPLANLVNTRRALRWLWPSPVVAFEESLGRIVVTNAHPLEHVHEGEWSDVHTTALAYMLETLGLSIPPATIDRAIAWHANAHAYNALTREALIAHDAWDGVPRIDTALRDYFHADDTQAHAIVSRILFLSMAARALWPGCKVDTCPVFCDETQGTSKSGALRILAGGPERFSDTELSQDAEKAAQSLRGKWIIELGEGQIMRKRDAQAMRVLLSAQTDHYRSPYARHYITVPRQVVFCMTTNDPEWSPSDTDERRYLPVALSGKDIDVRALRRDRVQLIGEAVARVLGTATVEDGPPEDAEAARARGAEPWWPVGAGTSVLREARAVHAPEGDPWHEAIAEWLARREAKAPVRELTLGAIFGDDGPVPMPVNQRAGIASRRVGKVLRDLGFRRGTSGRDRARVWVR